MSSVDRAVHDGPLKLFATAIAAIAAIGLAGAVVAARIPVWPCVLLQHFPVQLVAAGAVVVACTAALRARGSFDLAAIATLVSALWVAPDLHGEPRPVPAGGVPLRVLVLNVHTESKSFSDVRWLIEDLRPDVIGLVEVDRRWLDALAPAVAGYSGRLESPRDDNFGVALYARGPLTGAIERWTGELPSAVAHLVLQGAELDVVLIHPVPPMSAGALSAQIATLDAAADRAARMASPVVIMGDFNATPWSQPFRRILVRSGLCDSRVGFGIAPSFPADSTVLRIPIDHLLASCSIEIRDRRVERDVGSDHLPVVIDLAVPRQARAIP